MRGASIKGGAYNWQNTVNGWAIEQTDTTKRTISLFCFVVDNEYKITYYGQNSQFKLIQFKISNSRYRFMNIRGRPSL